MDLTYQVFLFNVAYTVFGGFLLTFVFFLLKEKFFSLPNLGGSWYLQIETKESSYNPYKNMKLRYLVILWREGAVIRGTAEKVYEKSATGEREYIGKQRTRAKVKGYIEKRYFSKDIVSLHVVEHGMERQSTNFYQFEVINWEWLNGSFISMVADQKGTAIMQRESF